LLYLPTVVVFGCNSRKVQVSPPCEVHTDTETALRPTMQLICY